MIFWSENDAKMEPKCDPKRPKMPTSCRHSPDISTGNAKGAKREPKRSPNGSQMEPKSSQK